MTRQRFAASFRDPSGFLFWHGNELYRHVSERYRDDYTALLDSGLYQTLVDHQLLIPADEVPGPESVGAETTATADFVLKPELVPFVSYPFEWCFGQLKAAALTTLAIQERCLKHGMTLKDASAYNITFHNGRPVLIDSLSFVRQQEGAPWIAYRQFCEHFLAPLALASYRDTRLTKLGRVYIDGVPLDLASQLLPRRTWLRPGLLFHLHSHARSQRRFADRPDRAVSQRKIGQTGLLALIDNLRSTINRLAPPRDAGHWASYYEDNSYSGDAERTKRETVTRWLQKLAPAQAFDLGANTGEFSRLAADQGIPTVSMDFDEGCVEQNFQRCTATGNNLVLPLVMDLTNPTPGLGWRNQERQSLTERGPADVVMALALVHHLAIAHNGPGTSSSRSSPRQAGT